MLLSIAYKFKKCILVKEVDFIGYSLDVLNSLLEDIVISKMVDHSIITKDNKIKISMINNLT